MRVANGLSVVRLPLIGILMVGMFACQQTTPEQHYERARAYVAEHDLNSAVIELKNALQADAQLGEARLLLGEVYTRVGDDADAAIELDRALNLGIAEDRVLPALMASKVRLGRHQEVIGGLEQRGQISPLLETVLGEAYLASGESSTARNLFLAALSRDASLAEAHVGLGKVEGLIGNYPAAADQFAQALELDPYHREGWTLQGENALVQGQHDLAIDAFTHLKGLDGGEPAGSLGLVRTHLMRGDLAAAQAALDPVLTRAPDYAYANYLGALIAFQKGDLALAEQSLVKVQSTAPDHPGSLYLMGAVKYQLGQVSQAQAQLERYLSLDPGNESVRKLLASLHAEQGNHAAVVATLETAAQDTQDAQLLAMLGTSYLRLGQQSQAAAAFERAVALEPDIAALRNQLALSLLSSGAVDAAEAQLHAAIALDGDQFYSDYMIAMMRVGEGHLDEALEAVDALLQKDPDQPLAYNLRAKVHLARGDSQAARADLERALGNDPKFEPAVRRLAQMALADGDAERAVGYWQALLDADPENTAAFIALARLAGDRGDWVTAKQMLRNAAGSDARDPYPRFLLAQRLLAEGALDEALGEVNRGLELSPDNVSLSLTRGRIFNAQGKRSSARTEAGRVQSILASENRELERIPDVAFGLGVVWLEAGDTENARKNLLAANAGFGGEHAPTLSLLARIDLMRRDLAGARARFDRLSELDPDPDSLLELEGDLLSAEGNVAVAVAKYHKLADRDNRNGVIKLANALASQGNHEDARRVIRDWIDEHPEDGGMHLVLANTYLNTPDSDKAMAIYERLVDSNNPVVLNNLAWLYYEAGNEQALDLARRAYDLAPDNADIADTLGWILVQEGSYNEGLQYLRASVAMRDQSPSIRYHVAVALEAIGDKPNARAQLRKALNLGAFPEMQEARALMERL